MYFGRTLLTWLIFLLEFKPAFLTGTDHGSNVYTRGGHPIQVFTIHSLNGGLNPVDLDMSQLPHVKYPEAPNPSRESNDIIVTSRGNQSVHHCNEPPLVARGREHHRYLHSNINLTDRGYNNSEVLSLLQKHIKTFGHGRRRRRAGGFDSRQKQERRYGGSRRDGRRDKKRIKGQSQRRVHVVETMLVFDYALYQRFLTASGNNRQLALLSLAEYYSQLSRSVIKRYESVSTAEFAVTIIPTQFIIAETPANSPWTETARTGDRVRSLTALQAFTTYANSLKTSGMAFDHAALVTGYDMYSNDLTGNLLGLAYLFGVCGSQATSINEESFSEQTANTVAHEIGHNLGSLHDGDGNSCSTTSFYIMAPTSALPTTPELGVNPWIFSSCSGQSFRSFLNTDAADCTLSLQSTYFFNINQYLTQEWGQASDADQQCRRRYGVTSRFCREDYFVNSDLVFNDMCYNLKCYNPNSRTCVLIPAHDGTSCGNQRWCLGGTCTVSLQAPARFENCPQGDDPTRTCNAASCADPNSVTATIYCCNTCGQILQPVPSPSPSIPPIPSPSPSIPPIPSPSPSIPPIPSPSPPPSEPPQSLLSEVELQHLFSFGLVDPDSNSNGI